MKERQLFLAANDWYWRADADGMISGYSTYPTVGKAGVRGN